MNILLFLPGLLCLLFQYRGLVGTLEGVISIVAVQVCHSTSFVLTPDLAPCSHAPGTPSIPVLPLVRGPVPHPSVLRLGIRFLPTILLQVDRQLAVPLRAVLPLSDTLHESCRDARELLEPILAACADDAGRSSVCWCCSGCSSGRPFPEVLSQCSSAACGLLRGLAPQLRSTIYLHTVSTPIPYLTLANHACIPLASSHRTSHALLSMTESRLR